MIVIKKHFLKKWRRQLKNSDKTRTFTCLCGKTLSFTGNEVKCSSCGREYKFEDVKEEDFKIEKTMKEL